MSRGEKTVIAVFLCTALAWVLRAPINSLESYSEAFMFLGKDRFDDTTIAMIGAISLFLIPIDAAKNVFALDWKMAHKLPWGVLLLFGGGFSLAEGMKVSKFADWIGQQVGLLQHLPGWLMVALMVGLVIFLGELTSNTPTAAALLPVFYGVAKGMEINPLLLLIPCAIAASCSFMLPVGTPPNAIAFGTGYVTMRQMCKAGIWINLAGILLITGAMYTIGLWAFKITP
jgi:sodium-dependent dicarboxylate transporter 2/3/5